MEVAIVVMVIVLVIGLIALVRRRPSKPPRRPDEQLAPADEPEPRVEPSETGTKRSTPPVFNIVALGPPGAGKTVYLASMFHHLNFRSEGRAYYLEASPEQVLALGQIYGTLSDTSQPWPTATRPGELVEYVFKCIAVDDSGAKRHILSLSYLDYDGSLLTRQHGGDAFERLSTAIHSGQALLAMIDGHRVLQLLRGERAGRNYFEYDARTMFALMQSTECPIHLVISKWDLVRGFGEPEDADERLRLDRAIDALMSFEHIRALVTLRDPNQIVRVIPVSAVGPSFAELGPGGVVVKRPRGHIYPARIEVPLCAVVPDLFKQIEARLDDAARQELNREVRRRIDLHPGHVFSGVAAVLKRPAGKVLRVVMQVFIGGPLTNEVVEMFLEWSARPYEGQEAKAVATREELERQLENDLGIRARVLSDFSRSVLHLEATLPNSSLAR